MKLWKFHSRYDETLKPRGESSTGFFLFFFPPLSLRFIARPNHSHSYAGRATRGLRVCLSFLMKDSRLALAFRERRINETGKIPWRTFNWRRVRRARVGAFEKVEQGPARNRRTFVRKLDERVIKLRKKHVGRDRITRSSCPHDDGYASVISGDGDGRRIKERERTFRFSRK